MLHIALEPVKIQTLWNNNGKIIKKHNKLSIFPTLVSEQFFS